MAKVPFPLTQKFKLMLQRGVDLSSLDVTYISSLSWYFLNLFGMQGLLQLILGEKTFDDTQVMQQQMSMGAGGLDAPNAFKAEKDQLELMQHTCRINQFVVNHNFDLNLRKKINNIFSTSVEFCMTFLSTKPFCFVNCQTLNTN